MSEIISQIRKRSGDIVGFSQQKIKDAIYKAALSVGIDDEEMSARFSEEVVKKIAAKFHKNSIPAVEEIQDIVEEVLI
jgi:anaerobic ribonucleoside-triphosphate reductase